MGLDERLLKELREVQRKLAEEGRLYRPEQLEQFYGNFRRRFGPEWLAQVDGEALLTLMHDHANRESLVYWLEFKDDEELPANFGSIAGGSALKFGIYRRKETGLWMTGSPSNQRELSLAEAVAQARKHRDQLVAGAAVLAGFSGRSDEDYAVLQQRLAKVAPEVYDTAWGRKYFYLMNPHKLDDFHNADWGRHHLIKLLQVPPAGVGRYLMGGRYVALAEELGLPIPSLTELLNVRDGDPHRYWRIGTSDGKQSQWQDMLDGQVVALGYTKLGDLSAFQKDRESKDRLKALYHQRYPGDPRVEGRLVQQIFHFVATMSRGDLVVAADGARVRGIGRIVGDYRYEPGQTFPHHRPVEWLSLERWQLREGLMQAVCELKDAELLVEVERWILAGPRPVIKPVPGGDPPSKGTAPKLVAPVLGGIPGKIQAVLERKGQVILYGPPGTGKTHWAEVAACDLAAYSKFGAAFAGLSESQQALVRGPAGLVRLCCFHPAYGYEDFLEGYRPEVTEGKVAFARRDGVFKRLCQDAAAQPQARFFLIIDEINRGDIPRIFGELLTGLERSKRGKELILPLSGAHFTVPKNVYVIGTMNTADRSIALLVLPGSTNRGKTVINAKPIVDRGDERPAVGW